MLDLKKYKSTDLLDSYEVIFRQFLASQMQDDETVLTNPIPYMFGVLLEDLKAQYLRTNEGRLAIILKLEKSIIKELAEYMNYDDVTLLQMIDNPDKQYKMFD